MGPFILSGRVAAVKLACRQGNAQDAPAGSKVYDVAVVQPG